MAVLSLGNSLGVAGAWASNSVVLQNIYSGLFWRPGRTLMCAICQSLWCEYVFHGKLGAARLEVRERHVHLAPKQLGASCGSIFVLRAQG